MAEIQKREGKGRITQVGVKTEWNTHMHMDEYGPLRLKVCLVCILCFH